MMPPKKSESTLVEGSKQWSSVAASTHCSMASQQLAGMATVSFATPNRVTSEKNGPRHIRVQFPRHNRGPFLQE